MENSHPPISTSPQKKRLLSLDVLRGITVVGMILVNNSGGKLSYDSLQHSAWNGLTLCDLVFPFFLFIMGVSTYIALSKFHFQASGSVVRKILKRTLVILCIGWAIHWFHFICDGDFFPFAHLRLTGVLPRIALCYCVVSFVALYVNHKYIGWIIGFLIAGYAVLLCIGNGYALDDTNLLAIIDRNVLGADHLYHKSPIDPEGLTSTLAAIAHTLIGFCCGRIILAKEALEQKTLKLLVAGFILMACGFVLTEALPLNKRIWSPTFVLVTCGFASLFLALLIWIIDINGKKKWTLFFESFGINPLYLYVQGDILAVLLGMSGISAFMYMDLFRPIFGDFGGSLAWAIFFVVLNWIPGYFLYKKKIYIKL